MATQMERLVFLKLGGSLITDKNVPHTHRPEVLARLVGEIASALREDPSLRVVLGHGSGSFGHVPGKRYGTRKDVRTPEQWLGFVEVWKEAWALNRLVMDALAQAGVAAIAFAPVSAVASRDGKIASWDTEPVRAALAAGILPVIYGDVVFDTVRGGTILSTEDLFAFLARQLHPSHLLLAGREPGVWADYPACTRLVDILTPASYRASQMNVQGSAATDVTGGMASKVAETLSLVESVHGLQALIFSGEQPGNVREALLGRGQGTRMRANS